MHARRRRRDWTIHAELATIAVPRIDCFVMKIAALSDIHGNLAALDAVLDDVRRRGADVIVNLGDIVSGRSSRPKRPSA